MISQRSCRLVHCTGHWSTAGSRTKVLIVELHFIFQVLSSGVMQSPTSNTHRSNWQACGILTRWPLGLLTARWRGNLTKPAIFVWYNITLFLQFGQILVGQFHDYFLLPLVHWVPHNIWHSTNATIFELLSDTFCCRFVAIELQKILFFSLHKPQAHSCQVYYRSGPWICRGLSVYIFLNISLGSKKWVDLDLIDAM